MLNACRRHGSFHDANQAATTALVKCSTPVGVMDRFTSAGVGLYQYSISCSTPVGVMDRFTKRFLRLRLRRRVCSTPVGVMDRFTRTDSSTSSPKWRAQRLSASWIVSPDAANAQPVSVMDRGVLNACRRHGSFHTPQPPPIAACTRAQRLSASWIVSHHSQIRPWRLPRAQRLSASWIVSHIYSCRVPGPARVLNACRRHGSFHQWHQQDVGINFLVLNACRRHGSFHPCSAR